MNEIIFLFHIFLVLASLWFAIKLGRSALITFIAFFGVLANLFVVKQVELFSLQVTSSDVFAIGGILGLNLLQELHGRSVARKASRISFFILICFACMAQVHLLYQPSSFDRTHFAFHLILDSSPRIIAASCFVFYLVQRLDIVWFGILKRFISPISVRVLLSLFLSQLLDTILFSFLGLYGLVASLFHIIVMSFAIKSILIVCSSLIAALLKRAHRGEVSA